MRRLIQWTFLAILLAACSADPSFAQRKGFGFGFRHHHVHVAAAAPVLPTYDTSIGNGVDANGYTSLPLNTGASRYYVDSATGSDANSCTTAKSASTPKASIGSALGCVVSGNGDQVLIAQSTSGYTFPNYSMKQGASPTYPTVVESYDPADPTNEAKLGRAFGNTRPVITGSTAIVGGGGASPQYIAIRGLTFTFGDVADAGVSNLPSATGEPNYLLYENDIFQDGYLNFDMTGSGRAQTTHVIVRNIAQYGAYGTSLSDHQQGIFAANIDGMTVEDSVFDNSGWKPGATRATLAASGGPTSFNHPLYIQDSMTNVVVRRNAFVQGSSDGGNLKSGGIYQYNLSLNDPEVAAGGNGGNSPYTHPFGAYLDYSYNVGIGGGIISTADGGNAQDWGFVLSNGIQNGSVVHHNIIAHSSAEANNAFIPNAVTEYSVTVPSYFDWHDNINWQWSASGSTIRASDNPAVTFSTYENNLWDDPSSGSNTNNTGHVFANAYTADGLAQALGYADLNTAVAAWIADPQRQWENGPALARTGYGVIVPALSNLTTHTTLTIGVPTTGQFIGTEDGSTLTPTGFPSCVTIFSDNRSWHYDGTCTAGTVNSTITETNGAATHNTALSWTIAPQPVLSSLTTTSTTTATFSTNTGNGNAYWVVSGSATIPGWALVRAGLNADGSAAVSRGSQAVSATGTQTISAIPAMSAGQYLDVAQLDSGNNPSATSSVAYSPSTPPATNIAVDFTHLDSTHLFQDTGCTSAVTTDLQTAKCIKDTTSGVIATNSTGWVFHQNGVHPYLAMDGTSKFIASTSVTFADATGQYGIWITANLTGSPSTSASLLDTSAGSGLLTANTSTSAVSFIVRSSTPAGANGTGTVVNTDQVYSGYATGTSGTSGNAFAFVNNAGSGTVAWSGTPLTATAFWIDPATTSAGRFYGMVIAKGDQTANLSGMQTYMAALE